MKRQVKSYGRTIFIFLTVIVVSGCGSTMSLHYEKLPVQGMNKGAIFVTVDDKRPADEGGIDPIRVGTVRNTFGMPFALNASVGREPSNVIKALISDCLMATGYNVLETQENSPRLHASIKSFWSDGYQHSRIWSILDVELIDQRQTTPLWSKTLESGAGATWTVGYGPFERAINNMLEELKAQLLAAFNDPNFQALMR